jgi:hypothetical protein
MKMIFSRFLEAEGKMVPLQAVVGLIRDGVPMLYSLFWHLSAIGAGES